MMKFLNRNKKKDITHVFVENVKRLNIPSDGFVVLVDLIKEVDDEQFISAHITYFANLLIKIGDDIYSQKNLRVYFLNNSGDKLSCELDISYNVPNLMKVRTLTDHIYFILRGFLDKRYCDLSCVCKHLETEGLIVSWGGVTFNA